MNHVTANISDEIGAMIAAHASGYRTDGMITDWIVIYAQEFTEDGVAMTAIGRITPGDVPWYRLMGLLDYAHAGFGNEIRYGADDGDDGCV